MLEKGTRVTVKPAYRMGGQYSADGYEGEWFVIRADKSDVLLDKHPEAEGKVWINVTRIQLANIDYGRGIDTGRYCGIYHSNASAYTKHAIQMLTAATGPLVLHRSDDFLQGYSDAFNQITGGK